VPEAVSLSSAPITTMSIDTPTTAKVQNMPEKNSFEEFSRKNLFVE
jgi:hypothetical protein